MVKFVGLAETLAPGFWVGVQYDEPLGKHNGTYVMLHFLNFLWFFYQFRLIWSVVAVSLGLLPPSEPERCCYY